MSCSLRVKIHQAQDWGGHANGRLRRQKVVEAFQQQEDSLQEEEEAGREMKPVNLEVPESNW